MPQKPLVTPNTEIGILYSVDSATGKITRTYPNEQQLYARMQKAAESCGFTLVSLSVSRGNVDAGVEKK